MKGRSRMRLSQLRSNQSEHVMKALKELDKFTDTVEKIKRTYAAMGLVQHLYNGDIAKAIHILHNADKEERERLKMIGRAIVALADECEERLLGTYLVSDRVSVENGNLVVR